MQLSNGMPLKSLIKLATFINQGTICSVCTYNHVQCTLMVSRALNDEQTCTPPTAHNTKIAPSRTLSDRSTSTVKSTCPTISKVIKCTSPFTRIMLICHFYNLQNFAHYAVLLSVGLSSVAQGYQKRTTSSFALDPFNPRL